MKIIVEINAGERGCGKCEKRDGGYPNCMAFNLSRKYDISHNNFFRLPACLAAQAGYDALIKVIEDLGGFSEEKFPVVEKSIDELRRKL
jgi:hypothetical protein